MAERDPFAAGPVVGIGTGAGVRAADREQAAPGRGPGKPGQSGGQGRPGEARGPGVVRPPGGPRRGLIGAGIGAAVIVCLGLVTLLVLNNTGTLSAAGGPFAAPDSSAPPLAKLCPPPTEAPQAQPAPPASGPRISDEEAGISYVRLDPPWRNWDRGVWAEGSLGVAFRIGQYFVTESYSGGDYLAGIQSGSVPATVNDGNVVDLKCTGQQVADDVRRSYYPQPNDKKSIRDEFTYLGGRPAWVSVFRLSFSEQGLDARDELVAVALIDVGRTTAAVLYLSIPGTHNQYDPVVDQVLASVRPLS